MQLGRICLIPSVAGQSWADNVLMQSVSLSKRLYPIYSLLLVSYPSRLEKTCTETSDHCMH